MSDFIYLYIDMFVYLLWCITHPIALIFVAVGIFCYLMYLLEKKQTTGKTITLFIGGGFLFIHFLLTVNTYIADHYAGFYY